MKNKTGLCGLITTFLLMAGIATNGMACSGIEKKIIKKHCQKEAANTIVMYGGNGDNYGSYVSSCMGSWCGGIP